MNPPHKLFKVTLLRILFCMSFGVHKYSSFLFDMYQKWNYWVLEIIFLALVIGCLKPLLPGLGRSSGEGKGYPLQYSGLENSMDCVWSMGPQGVRHD